MGWIKISPDRSLTNKPVTIPIKKYPIDPYPNDFHIGHCVHLRTKGAMFYWDHGQSLAIVLGSRVDYNTIVHEISHVVDEVSSYIEDDLKGEARAYLSGYLMDHVINYCKEKKIKIRK